MQIPEQMISLPREPFQREFTPEEDGAIPGDNLDDTMDWFQQPEPASRGPPRQLRSRTIGSISWDSFYGYRIYDVGEGNVQEEIRKPLPVESPTSWYGLELKEEWTDHTGDLLYESKPLGEESIETRSEDKDAQVLGKSISKKNH